MSRVSAILGLGIVVFAVTLALYVGTHLSEDAASILTGAACGIGAMLPAALVGGLTLLRRRGREQADASYSLPPQPMYPPVIVVAPPATNWPPASQAYMAAPPAPVPRQFTVIGDDSTDSDSA